VLAPRVYLSRVAAQVDVQVSERRDWVPLSHGRALPLKFWARIDDPDDPYVVLLEVVVRRGSADARQVVVLQRDDIYPPGPAVTSLRGVNVRDCLRLAIDAAARPRTDVARETGIPGAFQVEGEDPDTAWTGRKLGGRGSAADPDRLEVVAKAYLAAKAEGRPVREAVMAACGVEQSQAARLIRAAREAGKLAPRQISGPAISPELHRPPERYRGPDIFGFPEKHGMPGEEG
jgi:hypothetical protein